MTTELITDRWSPAEDSSSLVLLIDDQALVAAALQQAVAGEPDVDLHYCADPKEAIALANKLRPMVILLDLVMPQVDGLTLLRQFRENPATQYTPIIVLSTKEEAEIKSELFAAGANDYMVKLPDRLELLARIRYHSAAHLHRLQRDEAFEALRTSQQALVESNIALLAANTQLEKATQAKSEFLASMSHELRTPMNGIIGLTNILLESEPEGRQRENLTTVRQCAESLISLVNDILDFSKMEAHKLTLECIDFDLREEIETVLRLMGESANAKGIYLGGVAPLHVVTRLRGDPTRLRQVMMNLVSNAIKFTAEGFVAVRIAQLSETASHAMLCFEVQDTGTGIPPEARERLFQPFSQADESISRHYGGTGLGLAICRELVELMGGQIGLESEWGKGSTFRFTVALEKQPARAETSSAENESPAPCRALVVAAKPGLRLVIEQQMRALGLRASGVPGAEQALAVLRDPANADFRVAIIYLPVEEAAALAKAVKAESALSAMRLIFIQPPGKPAEPGTPNGFDACLEIPLRQGEALQAITAALEGSASKPAQNPPPQEPALRRDLKILLVEDNSVNRMVAQTLLQKLNDTVEVAVDGQKAVDALEHAPYDIILMDCEMPVLDGFEAARKIRALEKHRRQKPAYIVAMTAHAAEDAHKACQEAGMDDFLTKPVDIRQLQEALERFSKNQPA